QSPASPTTSTNSAYPNLNINAAPQSPGKSTSAISTPPPPPTTTTPSIPPIDSVLNGPYPSQSRYLLKEVIGKGSFSTVYLGLCISPPLSSSKSSKYSMSNNIKKGDRVAIKCLIKSDESKIAVQRKESELIARLCSSRPPVAVNGGKRRGSSAGEYYEGPSADGGYSRNSISFGRYQFDDGVSHGTGTSTGTGQFQSQHQQQYINNHHNPCDQQYSQHSQHQHHLNINAKNRKGGHTTTTSNQHINTLKHFGIVGLFETIETDDFLFLVLEYCAIGE
ncbi:hypothetical protein HDU76_006544, partial [Blyttiomyces sp. JEL0837]